MAPKHTLEHVREHARKYNAPLPKYSFEKLPTYVFEWVEKEVLIIDFLFLSELLGRGITISTEQEKLIEDRVRESLRALASQVYMFAERTPNTVTKGDKERPFALMRRLPKDAESRSQEIREVLRASTNNDERALLQEALENFDHVRRAQTGRYFNKLVSDQEWFKVLPADAATIATALYEDLFEPSSQHLLSTHKDPATRIDALLEQHTRFAREKAATIGLTEENSADMPPEFIEGKQYGPEEKKYTLRVLNDARHLAVEGQLMNNCVVSRAEQLVLADQEGDAGFTKKRNMLVFSLSVELPEPDTIANVRGIKANDIPKERRFADATFDDYKVTRKSELTFEYDVWTGRLGEVKRADNQPFPTDEKDPLYQAFFEVLRDLNTELKHRYRGRGIQSFGGDLQHLMPGKGLYRTITNEVKTLEQLTNDDVIVAGDKFTIECEPGTNFVKTEKLLRALSLNNIKLEVTGSYLDSEQRALIGSAKGSLTYDSRDTGQGSLSNLVDTVGDLMILGPAISLPKLKRVGGKTVFSPRHADLEDVHLRIPGALFVGSCSVSAAQVDSCAIEISENAVFKDGAFFQDCTFPKGIPDKVFLRAEKPLTLPKGEFEKYAQKFPEKVELFKGW